MNLEIILIAHSWRIRPRAEGRKRPRKRYQHLRGQKLNHNEKLHSSIIAGNGAEIKEEPMEIAKYPIPQRHLTTAIESLRELALRLELAKSVREACDYFLSL